MCEQVGDVAGSTPNRALDESTRIRAETRNVPSRTPQSLGVVDVDLIERRILRVTGILSDVDPLLLGAGGNGSDDEPRREDNALHAVIALSCAGQRTVNDVEHGGQALDFDLARRGRTADHAEAHRRSEDFAGQARDDPRAAH